MTVNRAMLPGGSTHVHALWRTSVFFSANRTLRKTLTSSVAMISTNLTQTRSKTPPAGAHRHLEKNFVYSAHVPLMVCYSPTGSPQETHLVSFRSVQDVGHPTHAHLLLRRPPAGMCAAKTAGKGWEFLRRVSKIYINTTIIFCRALKLAHNAKRKRITKLYSESCFSWLITNYNFLWVFGVHVRIMDIIMVKCELRLQLTHYFVFYVCNIIVKICRIEYT